MDKIYILDAVNYLFRSYYAIGPMTNAKGQSTSAVFGFIRSVQKLIKDFFPDHLICVFDGPDNKKSRQAVYAEYKMHRKGAPEDLFPQFEWANEYCELAGIPVLCFEGVEADDTMASVALWAEKKGSKVFLCSSDKDLMQLVNDRIFMLHLHKENLLVDAEKVKELFGVRPDQILDLLSMMGDASDNIPGLEGFGPKTAASLLQEFGTLDHILAHPEKVKGEKKQEVLRSQKEIALMSRELATLDTRIEIPKEEEFYRLKPPNKLKLIDFFHQMNFNSLLREMSAGESPKNPNREKRKPAIPISTFIIWWIQIPNSSSSSTASLISPKVGIDTETTSENPFLAELVGIGFCIAPGEAWYVPPTGNWEKKVFDALREFFAKAKGSFFGHNLKYDLHVLENIGIPLKKISFDTLLASYLLDPQNRRHNLDELALVKFKKVKIPLESLIGKGKSTITMREVPVEKVKEYCCEDIDYTTRLKELFEEELEEEKTRPAF